MKLRSLLIPTLAVLALSGCGSDPFEHPSSRQVNEPSIMGGDWTLSTTDGDKVGVIRFDSTLSEDIPIFTAAYGCQVTEGIFTPLSEYGTFSLESGTEHAPKAPCASTLDADTFTGTVILDGTQTSTGTLTTSTGDVYLIANKANPTPEEGALFDFAAERTTSTAK